MRPLRASFALALFALVSTITHASEGRRQPPLALAEARQYMLDLINRDRAQHGLRPVALDRLATQAGQRHAEEMATHCYLAHWNMAGKPPDERYCEAGGSDFVQENAALISSYRGEEPPDSLSLNPNATWGRTELEEMEAAYMNEEPPADGHRRNILDPNHTHVGIALAKAGSSHGHARVNTQEFVNHHLQLDPLPTEVRPGQSLYVTGRLPNPPLFHAISLAQGPAPAPMSPDDLQRTGTYRMPAPHAVFWQPGYRPSAPVYVRSDGSFSVHLSGGLLERPGLYYIAVWLKDDRGGEFIAAQRTIVVR